MLLDELERDELEERPLERECCVLLDEPEPSRAATIAGFYPPISFKKSLYTEVVGGGRRFRSKNTSIVTAKARNIAKRWLLRSLGHAVMCL